MVSSIARPWRLSGFASGRKSEFITILAEETAMQRVTRRVVVASVALYAVAGTGATSTTAAEPVLLRYGWKAGERFAYQMEIVADKGDETETLKGTPTFVVESVDKDGAKVVLRNKDLGSTTQAKTQGRPPFGIRPPGPPRIPRIGPPGASFQGHELTLDDRGRVVNERGDSQLPFVLGNLSALVFEPLPEKAEAAWKRTESTGISIKAGGWPPLSPFREDVEKERLNAEETTAFTIESVTADAVTIKKDYTLATVETVDGKPRLEFKGQGTITFDRRRNVPARLDYAANFFVRENNREVKFPIKATYRLLTGAEVADLDAKAAASAAELKAAPTGDERSEMLANLKSGEKSRALRSLQALQQKEPAAADEEVSAALAEWLTNDDRTYRWLAAQALERWGTEKTAPALRKAIGDDFPVVANSAMKALGRLKDKDAVEPLVAGLADLQKRQAAAAALKSLGVPAEREVRKALEHAEWQVRLEAVRILKEIGTAESVATLKSVGTSDDNALVKREAKEAAKAIEDRK
jgi:hypothetical protein